MRFEFGKKVRLMIRLAADHRAVDVRQRGINPSNGRQTAVDDDLELRKVPLQVEDAYIIEGRDLSLIHILL